MNWFLQAIRHKYATFAGRAQRKEYWFFVLWYCVFYLGLLQADALLMRGSADAPFGAGPLSAIFAVATLLPAAAITVRRLHDTGRSGWWALIGLVPLIGDLVIVVFAVQAGEPGPNRYGPDPRAAAAPPVTTAQP